MGLNHEVKLTSLAKIPIIMRILQRDECKYQFISSFLGRIKDAPYRAKRRAGSLTTRRLNYARTGNVEINHNNS